MAVCRGFLEKGSINARPALKFYEVRLSSANEKTPVSDFASSTETEDFHPHCAISNYVCLTSFGSFAMRAVIQKNDD